MKSLITVLSICLIFFASCKTDTKTPSETATASTAETKTEENTTTPAEGVHIAASAEGPIIGLWHYQDIGGNQEKGAKYKGRWIDLKRNNTFTSGIYLEENNSGTWSYDGESKIIKLELNKEEEIEREWKINSNGDFHIWLGNAGTNKSGLQIRMARKLDGSRPGK